MVSEKPTFEWRALSSASDVCRMLPLPRRRPRRVCQLSSIPRPHLKTANSVAQHTGRPAIIFAVVQKPLANVCIGRCYPTANEPFVRSPDYRRASLSARTVDGSIGQVNAGSLCEYPATPPHFPASFLLRPPALDSQQAPMLASTFDQREGLHAGPGAGGQSLLGFLAFASIQGLSQQ